VDPEMGFRVYETTPGCDRAALMERYSFRGGFISNSDAHDLIAIQDAERTLAVEKMSPRGVIEAVRRLGETQ